jgi:phosphoribosylamine--glycine ligase
MAPVILIVGKDARTDAIAAACAASPRRPELYALSELRIPGLVERCRQVFRGSLTDPKQLISVAREIEPDLVIIGPEQPLAAGCIDELTAHGFASFGPSRSLARVESSKAWARSLLDRHGIPGNPAHQTFERPEGIEPYMEELGEFVVKPDGLTAGKGVRLSGEHLASLDEAREYAVSMLDEHGRVLIEERLEGEEFSLQTITDGVEALHLPIVQDHKRAFEDDQGPNTGGMGSYSCADLSLPFLTGDDVAAARSINEQVIEALARDTGEPYRGVLYGGFMATRDGIRLIEYNARFGDPEAMNVLPLLQGDFVELCSSVAAGQLDRAGYSFAPKATVCKYIVPADYPDATAGTNAISVPDEVRAAENVHWYWSACEGEDGNVYLTSSRAGAVVGIDDSLTVAERAAEEAARQIRGRVRHRSDIGSARLVAARVRHMQSLRHNPTSDRRGLAVPG